jgi:lysyl-tRNA synthetase class II
MTMKVRDLWYIFESKAATGDFVEVETPMMHPLVAGAGGAATIPATAPRWRITRCTRWRRSW